MSVASSGGSQVDPFGVLVLGPGCRMGLWFDLFVCQLVLG